MSEIVLCWKFQNQENFLITHNSSYWYEYSNGNLISTYETVYINANQTEAILYQPNSHTYFKLTPTNISLSHAYNGDYTNISNGGWLIEKTNEITTINSERIQSSPAIRLQAIPKILRLAEQFKKEKIKTENLFKSIRESEITTDYFEGPFGEKKILYLDYTASGRSLKFIEEFITNKILPSYSNTHSEGNHCAETTSECRDRARLDIKNSINAKQDVDELIFVGSGSTSAIHKLIGILDITKNSQPVVVVSPYEHHSNLLPWREKGAEIIYAIDSNDSSIDLVDLETKLSQYGQSKRLKIGSFTAASNVTGILLDIDKISSLLHKYGFLSFWDYSTAAPYLKIDMNPISLKKNDPSKDAIFFSGHKLIGGPQTPGVLVAKKKLFRNKVPHNQGGGTVLAVNAGNHIYDPVNEAREEGGTPAIIESIRLGLVFKFKDELNPLFIEQREHQISTKALDFFKKIPNLILLGNLKLNRLPIFSFLIKNKESGYYLHHNFVTRLLNDLFGIQSRSGCACAGPYGHQLLGISEELSSEYVDAIVVKDPQSQRDGYKQSHTVILKPGFTRFNIPYFLDDERIDFILKCIKFLCEHGWKFLPLYKMNIENGQFKHIMTPNRNTHLNTNIIDMITSSRLTSSTSNSQLDSTYMADCLLKAKESLDLLNDFYEFNSNEIESQKNFFRNHDRIRWFLLPCEAFNIYKETVLNKKKYPVIKPPFAPFDYSSKSNTNNNDTTAFSGLNFSDLDKCVLCGEYHDEFAYHFAELNSEFA